MIAFQGILDGKIVHVDGRNTEGETALYCAAMFGRTEIAALLIDKGANLELKKKGENQIVNLNNGKTALAAAACFCFDDIAIVTLLLDKGAQVDCKDNEGKTPLDHMRVFFLMKFSAFFS